MTGQAQHDFARLHRASFDNEHEGHPETFRPYAMPDGEWIREAGERLKK